MAYKYDAEYIYGPKVETSESGKSFCVTACGERRERIVRCRDCAMYDDEDGMCMRDPEHTGRGWYARPDGFCAWGERKGE